MNVLKALLLTLVIAAAALAQTQNQPTTPAAPACLAGPVTQGNVTLSCSMVDATGGSDTISYGYVFGIKATSSDPDVLSLRIELTTVTNPLPDGTFGTSKRAVLVPKSANGGFSFAFLLMPTYDVTGTKPSPTAISAINVQELKASSSQAF